MTGPGRRALGMDGVDLLVLVLFAGVVALAAATVLMSGPETAASVLLLAGLTGFVALAFLDGSSADLEFDADGNLLDDGLAGN